MQEADVAEDDENWGNIVGWENPIKAEEIQQKSRRNPLHYERRNPKEIHFTLTEEKGFITLFWVIPHLLFQKHVLSHIFAFPLRIILNDENATFSLVIRTMYVVHTSLLYFPLVLYIVISIAMAMIINLIQKIFGSLRQTNLICTFLYFYTRPPSMWI